MGGGGRGAADVLRWACSERKNLQESGGRLEINPRPSVVTKLPSASFRPLLSRKQEIKLGEVPTLAILFL